MLKAFALVMLLACIGCQTIEKAPLPKTVSTTETVTITVKQHKTHYSMEAKWVAADTETIGPIINESKTVLSAPKVTGKPDQWMTVNISSAPKGYSSVSLFMINNEMVEINSAPGLSLAAKITPQDNDSVEMTGVFSSMTNDRKVSTAFSGTCIIGVPTVIYQNETKQEPVH